MNKTGKPQPSAHRGQRSLEWQVRPGHDSAPYIEAVAAGLERLSDMAHAFKGGDARAADVQGDAGTTLLTILAFGDDAFAAVVTLMQSLGFTNVLSAEDPETGLDAVFVPHSRPAPQRKKGA
jgi:hypothetical protein